MRAINIVLAVAVSLILGLLVFEGGLRLIGKGPEDTGLEFDPGVGWRKKPGDSFERSSREFDVTIEVNEFGLRDDPMDGPSKPDGTFRVLMLGDSFTLGFTVARDDLFVDQLERWWTAEGRKIDVVNAGTQGFSTDQSVAWLIEHGKSFEPDLVLLFPYENDLYWNGQTSYMGKDKPRFTPEGELEPRELVDTSENSWLSKLAIAKLLGAGAEPDVLAHTFTPAGGTRPILKEQAAVLLERPDFMQDAVARTGGVFRAFKRTCDEIGARAVVVPIPSKAAIDADYRRVLGEKVLGLQPDAWSPDEPVTTFRRLAEQQGLDVLDPRTTLTAASSGQEIYYNRDWHFNPAGNRAFALFLHDELDHLGVFPPAHTAPRGADIALPEVRRQAGMPGWIKLYAILWLALTLLYIGTYRDEPIWQPPFKVAVMLSAVFAIVIGGGKLIGLLPPNVAAIFGALFVLGVLGFVAYKLGRRLGTIAELFKSFILRGHWYLMPLVVVLLTIGSLLVVAASSPLVAPFIYTLF